MSDVVLFHQVSIHQMQDSAISISKSVPLVVVFSLITSCSANKGGGIFLSLGSLLIEKTCVSECIARSQGSAIYSTNTSTINRSSVSRCAPIGQQGADDAISCENDDALIKELNSSRGCSKESSAIQLATCKSSVVSYCIFALGKGSYIFQCYNPASCCYQSFDIFINNTENTSTIFYVNAESAAFDSCIFFGNKSPILFATSSDSLPAITFTNVVYLDSSPTGVNQSYSTILNRTHTLNIWQETKICRFECERTKMIDSNARKNVLKTIIISLQTLNK